MSMEGSILKSMFAVASLKSVHDHFWSMGVTSHKRRMKTSRVSWKPSESKSAPHRGERVIDIIARIPRSIPRLPIEGDPTTHRKH
jgi:hypothetical protein